MFKALTAVPWDMDEGSERDGWRGGEQMSTTFSRHHLSFEALKVRMPPYPS